MLFFNKLKFTRFKKNFSPASFLLGAFLALVISGIATTLILVLLPKQINKVKAENNSISIIKPVNAAEIYPEFVCGCCGKPLDPDNICCGDMKQKIDYIDVLVDVGLSEDDIILKSVKKFGINSLTNSETQQEIKNKLAALAPTDAPKIIFEVDNYDFGNVSQSEGEVFTYFDFKNEGKGNLIIDKINTSCGCTSASIVYQGQEGPTFTMPGHGKANPQNWSVSIAPGDVAQLKVYYDTNAHGKQKEANLLVTRTVSIFSNDPVEFEKRIIIELNQTP